MRLKPKGAQSVALLLNRGTRTHKTAGVQAGAYSFIRLLERNIVNPSSRLLGEAGRAARLAVGWRAEERWKKPRPSGNGTDRGWNITPPRKRADFQPVVRYESAGRTFPGRKSQMNVEQSTCASSARAQQWDQIDWDRCERRVRRLQARIVKATRESTRVEPVPRSGALSRLEPYEVRISRTGSKGRGWPQGHPLTRRAPLVPAPAPKPRGEGRRD